MLQQVIDALKLSIAKLSVNLRPKNAARTYTEVAATAHVAEYRRIEGRSAIVLHSQHPVRSMDWLQ